MHKDLFFVMHVFGRYKWQIPLTYITQQTPKQSQQVWMQEGPGKTPEFF